jgi:hypothetical protein
MPPWTRQEATAFNQPLSLDTSSVTGMSRMFYVRASACAFCPHSRLGHTRIPLCATSPRHAFSSVGCPLWTRQRADVFNQPLSFDSSSVTAMNDMFYVRFRQRVQSSELPPAPSAHTPELGHTHMPRARWVFRPSLCVPHLCATRFHSVWCPPWTRQEATAFNQPLSLDTSMEAMFYVRSARALGPQP